jgi:hypothetical protein
MIASHVLRGLGLAAVLCSASCVHPRAVLPADAARKIELNMNALDADGLRGAADGKVAMAYEFAIPNTAACRAEVRAIDRTVQFMPGAQGRIGAREVGCLCIGSTHQPDYRAVLWKVAALPYVQRIVECYFE